MTMLLTVVGITLRVVIPADAHVAPSVDDNNRYLKVTPMRGGFRLAYTVFFGEIPGASERRGIDENRDGRIDDTEAKRFGDKLASQVAASLTAEVGAMPQRITWAVVDVGFGTNTAVTAGSFSVDMVAYVCGSQRLVLRDQFRIPRPGETEVKVEDSPGVTIKTAHVGAADDAQHDFKFLGAGGPLTEDGLVVEWTAAPDAPAITAECAKSAGPQKRTRMWLPAAIGGGLGAIVAVVVLVRRRRKKP